MKFYRLLRETGLVEIVCEHGCGHPSQLLTGEDWENWMLAHGCDGCCMSDAWREAELDELKKRDPRDDDDSDEYWCTTPLGRMT